MTSPTPKLDPAKILQRDGFLKPHIPGINTRWDLYSRWKATIDKTEGGYEKFSKGYEKFGLNVGPDNTITYREWAPNAVEASLIGDFSTSFSPLEMTALADAFGRCMGSICRQDV